MLQLIQDCRSGTRLEVVIPVLNEEARIGTVITHYHKHFDIVVLDGGSSDKTVDIALSLGATVFRRAPGPIYTEEFFVHYANHVTKCGYTFYLFADEYFEIAMLTELEPFLRLGGVIIGRRVDWCYGFRMNWMRSDLPRGFVKGDAIFNQKSLHQGLLTKSVADPKFIDIQHLQIWDMRRFLGQCGGYAYVEVKRLRTEKHPAFKFIRRFIIFEIAGLPRRIWKQRSASLAFHLWQILIALLLPIVGLLCLLEQKYLLTPEQQHEFYRAFYDRS